MRNPIFTFCLNLHVTPAKPPSFLSGLAVTPPLLAPLSAITALPCTIVVFVVVGAKGGVRGKRKRGVIGLSTPILTPTKPPFVDTDPLSLTPFLGASVIRRRSTIPLGLDVRGGKNVSAMGVVTLSHILNGDAGKSGIAVGNRRPTGDGWCGGMRNGFSGDEGDVGEMRHAIGEGVSGSQ
ncbi:hypothetical protein NX059_007215 [Plenodomus lindquistii]|nr:hypothetical protein NX059_007215 [Plenodomus lindquistii]